jgi:hypothetical protein
VSFTKQGWFNSKQRPFAGFSDRRNKLGTSAKRALRR